MDTIHVNKKPTKTTETIIFSYHSKVDVDENRPAKGSEKCLRSSVEGSEKFWGEKSSIYRVIYRQTRTPNRKLTKFYFTSNVTHSRNNRPYHGFDE